MFAKNFAFILSLIFLSINSAFADCDLESVKIVFYYGPSFEDRQFFDLDDAASILQHPKFIHKKTHFYSHGYDDSQDSAHTQMIAQAYYQRDSINCLSLEWTKLVNGSLHAAIKCAVQLAPLIAKTILRLFDAGLDRESFTPVGHSLGALLLAAAARNIIERTNQTVMLSRLTCLDPANTFLAANSTIILPPISKYYADFVDVIHTDAGVNGQPFAWGDVGFWPNGGTPIQPGCKLALKTVCSHIKAIQYWAQSIAKEDEQQLMAYPAFNYITFLLTGGDTKKAVLMGVECPTSATGSYYLKIRSTYGGDLGKEFETE